MSLSLEESLALENAKHDLSMRLEVFKAEAARAPALISGLFSYASGTMRSLLIVNGGAVIAILSVLSTLISASLGGNRLPVLAVSYLIINLSYSIIIFVASATSTIAALGLSYVSQVQFLENAASANPWANGRVMRRSAMICASLAASGFICASVFAALCFLDFAGFMSRSS